MNVKFTGLFLIYDHRIHHVYVASPNCSAMCVPPHCLSYVPHPLIVQLCASPHSSALCIPTHYLYMYPPSFLIYMNPSHTVCTPSYISCVYPLIVQLCKGTTSLISYVWPLIDKLFVAPHFLAVVTFSLFSCGYLLIVQLCVYPSLPSWVYPIIHLNNMWINDTFYILFLK